jgi:hypothetical protein
VLLHRVGERPADAPAAEVGVHREIEPADGGVVQLPLVHGAGHDPAVDPRTPQQLRLVRVVPEREQLGGRVRDVGRAVAEHLGCVPRLDARREVLAARSVERLRNRKQLDLEAGHRQP